MNNRQTSQTLTRETARIGQKVRICVGACRRYLEAHPQKSHPSGNSICQRLIKDWKEYGVGAIRALYFPTGESPYEHYAHVVFNQQYRHLNNFIYLDLLVLDGEEQ